MRKLFKLFQDNKGYGLISVLLVSGMLLMLGAACIFGSLMNAQVKETGRGDLRNFNTLEGRLEADKNTLKNYVSLATERAYEWRMRNYYEKDPDPKAVDMKEYPYDMTLYEQQFVKELYSLLTMKHSDTGGNAIYSSPLSYTVLYNSPQVTKIATDDVYEGSTDKTEDGMYYAAGQLKYAKGQFMEATGSSYSATDYANIFGKIFQYDSGRVSKRRSITFVNEFDADVRANNFDMGQGIDYSNILAGFVVLLPMFEPVADGTPTNLRDFIVISGGDLVLSEAGMRTFTGNIYDNRILVNGGVNTFEPGRNEFKIDYDAATGAWSGYNAYIADDLEIFEPSGVTIRGRYAGLGNMTTSDVTGATASSAILVSTDSDAGKVSLQLEMEKLVLSGVGFVWDTYNASTTEAQRTGIMMGNSIAVKKDQEAYLVPESFMNPGDTTPTTIMSSGGGAFTNPGPNPPTLPATIYGVPVAGYTTRVQQGVPGNKYYFLQFSGLENAIKYFKAFMANDAANNSAHLTAVRDYFNNPGSIFGGSNDSVRGLSWGNGPALVEGSTYSPEDIAYDIGASVGTYPHNPDANTGVIGSEKYTGGAYDFYVKKEPPKTGGTDSPDSTAYKMDFEVKDPSAPGGVKKYKAAFIRMSTGTYANINDYRISKYLNASQYSGTGNEDYMVIACTGNIDIDLQDLTHKGLIIANGNVNVIGDASFIEANKAELIDLYENAVNEDGEHLYDYLKYEFGGRGGSATDWDLNKLGKVENFIKNEDLKK